ncbi:DUF4262 domain-containing protein [Hymenobacter sp. CRA2]|uniref:DUF4262 domain-containing protein n=1 Tax=Hymenobacter sp. CRA2 TaxID=1955620 RepID=UPI00098FE34C|nr:DUF4262 domain-containing protein [Hymenobacter sp. CRA2]OON68848.1 hypothetical protein B0919_11790 [Hymenobacter sp. CRA2]
MTTPEEHAAHNAEAERQILHDVQEHGFFVALFHGDGYSPGFAYTIGLFQTYGYPELICFGLGHELMHSLFWEAKRLFDEQPQPDLNVGHPGFLEGHDVRFLVVDKACYADYLGYGMWFYNGRDFPALQLVWPDQQGLFPWQDDFKADWKFLQPLLDRDLDFKFREERNLGVFTTRQVLEGLPVLRVSHDTDGDWQFLCTTTAETEDLRIVALEEILKRDPSLNELYQLNYGWSAWRETPEHEWETWEQAADEDTE